MTSFSQALDGHLVFQYANRVPARLRVSHFTARRGARAFLAIPYSSCNRYSTSEPETRDGGWGTAGLSVSGNTDSDTDPDPRAQPHSGPRSSTDAGGARASGGAAAAATCFRP